MSEVKVNKISPRANCGTVTLGDSGDTFTIPAGATITNNGTANGFGATGSASWTTTVKTSGFTAVAGEGYFVNTTSGAISVNLPAGTAGAVVAFKDYLKTFDTHALTLVQNGSDKIGGSTVNAVISTEGIAITLVFVDSVQGWLVTDDGLQSEAITAQYVAATGGNTTATCGDFKIHTFTGPGTFCVSSAGNAEGSNAVEYIVVGGGGGAPVAAPPGDFNYASGGGGAGGFRFASPSLAPATYPGKPLAAPAGLAVPATAYPITVGAGGSKGQPGSSYAASGSNSIFSSITATGGGRGGVGGNGVGTPGTDSGANGGSGGGSGAVGSANGGSGNTPPVNPAQGKDGGEGTNGGYTAGGGGGGALADGNDGAAPPTPGQEQGGNGGVGAGIPTAFGSSGSPSGGFQFFSGGGGGGATYISSPQNGTNSTGGTGGGGPGKSGSSSATDGTANTGGGGGGAGAYGGPNNGGAGGSGIVIIRYKFQN